MRLRLLLRQATSSLGASLAIVLIVAVAAGLFAAWPRLSRAAFVDEVNYRIETTPETARALTGRQAGSWALDAWGGVTFDRLADQLDEFMAQAGPTLRPRLGDPELLVTAARGVDGVSFTTEADAPSDLAGRAVRLRAIRTLADHVQMVDGELPSAWTIPQLGSDQGWGVADAIPIALSVATAERLGVAVGDELQLDASVPIEDAATASAVVVGIFEATDPGEAYWAHQTSGLSPQIVSDPNAGDFAIGSAYVHPDTMGLLQILSLSPTTDIWVPVSAGADDAPALLDDLRDLVARDLTLGYGGLSTLNIRVETALIDLLDDAIISQRGTAAVLTLVAAGPVGVTFALLALATRLSVSRRRATLALASARGGSPWQIRGALAGEGLALGIPAAALGAGLATLLVRESFVLGDYLLPVLAALAPAAFLAAERLPNLRTQRHDLTSRSSSSWRWVVEVLVVAIAAGAVYLLLSRGLQATTTATVDPLATGTPLLISLATAVLATRLFPYPMRLVHAAMRRRRGLAAFLGSARAIRESGAGLVPMLALLVATSIAVFSTAMLTTLTTGVGESTLASTGADVRLVGPPYPDETVAEIQAVAGVAATTRIFTQPQTAVTAGTVTQQATLYAVDTTTIGTVQEGIEGAITLPAGMDALEGDAVPVVLSGALTPDDDSGLSVRMNDVVPVIAVGSATSASGFAQGALWAVVDLELLREVTGQSLVPRMMLIDLEPGADVDAAMAAITEIVDGQGTITTSAAQEATFLSSPAAVSMQIGFVVALVLSVLQSVLALVLTLVLAAPERGRLVAVLRTLGIGARDARRLVSWELVPLAVVALLVGTALGLVLPHLVVATVDLSVFTGLSSPPVVYDWARLGLVLAGVVAVVGLTLLTASAVARRLSLSVLRIGDAT